MATKTKAPETLAEAVEQKKEQLEDSAPAKAVVAAEKADLKVAINLIVQTGADGKPEEVLPGTTFYPAKVDLGFLVKHEAVREPTDSERLMHEHVEKLRVAAAESAPSADETLG